MLYGCLILYLALIYIRPAEIVASWETIPFLEIFTIVSGVVAAFSLAAKPRRLRLPHDKLLLAFWVVISISNLLYWVWAAYDSWMSFMPVVFCYCLIRFAVQRETQLRGLIYVLVILTMVLAINGIVQYQTGFGLGDVTMQLGRIRGTGIFNDPNDLGLSFVMAVPFLLVFITGPSVNLLSRLWWLIQLALVLLAMFYTNSRGAIVGLGAALICFTFLKFRRLPASLVGIALVAIIIAGSPSRASQMSYDEESAQSRIQSWAEGWIMLKSNPVLGVGHNRFTDYNYLVAHNSFVQTFAELGLVGAFCFVGMFYWYFKGLVVTKNGATERWRVPLLSSGVGVLTCSWFLSRQYVVVLYILLAIGASAAALGSPDKEDGLTMTWRDGLNIALLTVVGLVAVNISIRTMAVWTGG